MKNVELFIPTSLSDQPDEILWIMHSIGWQVMYKKHGYEGFAPLSSKVLRSVLGNGYCQAMKTALDCRYIESDNHFVIGEKCRGYRLCEPYRSEPYCIAQITDPAILKRLDKYSRRESAIVKQQINGTTYKPCIADLKQVTIADIDWGTLEFQSKGGWNLDKVEEHAKYAVRKLRRRQWFYTICPYGRLHTNITNLNNNLIPYVRLAGEPIITVDIANSQPLFLAITLRQMAHGMT